MYILENVLWKGIVVNTILSHSAKAEVNLAVHNVSPFNFQMRKLKLRRGPGLPIVLQGNRKKSEAGPLGS